MTEDERRQELEQIRNSIGGGRRIAEIYRGTTPSADDHNPPPASFVQAMINSILRREFPPSASADLRLEVGDLVRTAEGLVGKVVIIDAEKGEAYIRLNDGKPGAGLSLVKAAELEKLHAPPPDHSTE